MTSKEIDKLKPGEDLDELIAKHVMQWGDDAINNPFIPIPEYSTSRSCVTNAIDALKYMQPEILNKFDSLLEKYIDQTEATLGGRKCRPSDFLIFITPDDICRAALKAVLI